MSFSDLFKRSPNGLNETKDPVCGMMVNLDQAEYKSTYQGKTYGFCSQNCQETFDKRISGKNSTPHAKHSCCC